MEEIEESSYLHHILAERETEATEHRRTIVKKLLEKLPESERTVVTLYYLGEMSAKEIGRFLGVSVNTITSRLQRARKRLRTEKVPICMFFVCLQMAMHSFQLKAYLILMVKHWSWSFGQRHILKN